MRPQPDGNQQRAPGDPRSRKNGHGNNGHSNGKPPALNHRLSGADAAFLYLERKEIPLHIASVALFDGVIPFDEFVANIDSKLHLIPRYRQVAVAPPYNLSYPTWEYDRHFDIHRHIFRARVEAPGGTAELERLAGQILSQVLDRRKPLWEIHVIDGLADGKGALLTRVHHALADGVSGAALLKVMLDPTPEGSRAIRKPRYRPPRREVQEYSMGQAIGKAVDTTLENLAAAETGLMGLAQSLASERTQQGLKGMVSLLPELATPVERLPFNRPCGGERKFCWTETDFGEVKAIRDALGGTVNDVILTVLTRALARYVKLHDETVVNRLLRVICPVSLRRDDQGETLGNRISFMPVVLPMDIRSPARHLRAVAMRTEIMKSARAADLVALAAGCLAALPPPVQAMLWQGIPMVTLPVPLFNIICTNVPGSPVPLYSAGRRMLTSYPQVPTGYDLGVGCAVQSYDGKFFWGLTADADAAPDVEKLRDLIPVCFAELCKAAGVKQKRIRTAPGRAPRKQTTPVAAAS